MITQLLPSSGLQAHIIYFDYQTFTNVHKPVRVLHTNISSQHYHWSLILYISEQLYSTIL